MDTFTFKNIAEGEKFKVVNRMSGKVYPTTPIMTKVKPFLFKEGRTLCNFMAINKKGFTYAGTLNDDDAVVLL